MLRLLLDEHLSDDISLAVNRLRPVLFVVTIREWHSGRYPGVDDDVILRAAASEGLTLVTFDQRTIRPLLRVWSVQGIAHGGILFGSTRSLAPSDFGGIARAISRIFDDLGDADWMNRVEYLRRDQS